MEMLSWVLVILVLLVLVVGAFYALAIPFCMIAEAADDNWLVPTLIYAAIAILLYFFSGHAWSFAWTVFQYPYDLFMESPWFWSFVLIGGTVLLFNRPDLFFGALILSGIIYGIYYLVTGTAMSIYGFFGWAIAILATTPLAGVPLIVMLIGGYAAGRWMARL